MFAKTESTESSRFLRVEETAPWLGKKKPAADPDPEEDDLADGVEGDVDADDLEDDELDDDELDDDLDDDELDDDDDLDDLDDEIDDDLIELDDEYDKAEEEKHRPAHPGKYDD